MDLAMNKKRLQIIAGLIIGLITVITTIGISPPPVSAQAYPAPDVFTNSANCFRNIIQSGDLYCLVRYELPTFTTATPPPATPEAWCKELVNTDGCIADPVEPTQETSLVTNAAFITLYKDCGAPPTNCSTGDIQSQVRMPRINHSIGGVYISDASTITWGDTTVNACVESSDLLFSVQSSDCLTVAWNTAEDNQTDQRDQLGRTLLDELRAVETNRNLPFNSYVANSYLSTGARVLALEALSVMDQIIPAYFQAASETALIVPYATPVGSLALQVSIDATAAATDIPAAFVDLGDTVAGVSGGAMATVFFGILASLFFFWVYSRTGDYVLPAAGFITVGMIGIWTRGPTVSVVAVAAVVMSMIAAMFILRKISA